MGKANSAHAMNTQRTRGVAPLTLNLSTGWCERSTSHLDSINPSTPGFVFLLTLIISCFDISNYILVFPRLSMLDLSGQWGFSAPQPQRGESGYITLSSNLLETCPAQVTMPKVRLQLTTFEFTDASKPFTWQIICLQCGGGTIEGIPSPLI